jgi:hypothetical protein
MTHLITNSINIFSNINRTESNEKENFNMCVNFSLFKNFALLYSRVGAGAVGAALNFYPKPEPHKNDDAPQHWFQRSQ